MHLFAKRTFRLIFWLVIIGLIAVGLAMYWHHQVLYPTTDDAYVEANVVHIAPQVSGPVDQVYVKNFESVTQGQLLFTIDPRPFHIALLDAQAKLASAKQKTEAAAASVNQAESQINARQSQLLLAEENAKRMLKLVKDGQLSKQEGDQLTSAVSVARANLIDAKEALARAKAELGEHGNQNADIRQAQANLAQAKLNLGYTKIYAPESGQVANFNLRPGTMLNAGQSIFSIVEKNSWWVATNFKETQLDRIRSGQAAEVTLDMYPDHPFHGKILYISPGSGASFSILPPENASGNWVKVTQRFPVRIVITDPPHPHYPLRVGASATVTVNTTTP